VHVLFHQYQNIKSCKPAIYNHFASLIPVPHFQEEMLVKPWWEKVYGVNGYDCSKDVKAKKEKSKLSKIERKQLNEARTLHYLKKSDQGSNLQKL
jgi:hypothetical protein